MNLKFGDRCGSRRDGKVSARRGWEWSKSREDHGLYLIRILSLKAGDDDAKGEGVPCMTAEVRE